MARILLPTDFSENAHQSAEYAVRLFGTTDHRYLMFHAYADMGLSNPMLAGMAAEVVASAKDDLERAAERLRASTGAYGIESRMVNGPTSMAVRTIMRKEGADLVVMGRRGMAGASFFGSNTTDTIRNGDIAVLAVPEAHAAQPPGTILLASDDAEITPESLAPLRLLAQAAGSAVTVVHVTQANPSDDAPWRSKLADEALAGIPVSFTTHPGEEVAAAIADAAAVQGAGMIAVLHRQRGFLDRLFSPSIARKLALESPLPLLVLAQR